MKKPEVRILVFLLCILTTFVNAQDATTILKKVSEKYEGVSHIGYQANYQYTSSEFDDSIFRVKGQVWYASQPTDTIFGSVFHLNGESKAGKFDYYYDGLRGYEAYHENKNVTILNPYSYPNNDNNPAKTRTSLRIYNSLLTRRSIADYLLVNYPYAKNPKLSVSPQNENWILKVTYPANSSGALISFELVISQKDYSLRSSQRTTLWNGTKHTERFEFENIVTDNSVIQENIFLSGVWEGYSINETAKKSTMVLSVGNWEGQMAPSFSFPRFDNGNLSLTGLKGKYVLLDFWETWCGYCILAIPKLDTAYAKFKSKGVEFVGITTENRNGVERIISSNKIPYPQLKGDLKIIQEFGITARPVYVLLDKEGKVLIYDDWDRIEKFLETLK